MLHTTPVLCACGRKVVNRSVQDTSAVNNHRVHGNATSGGRIEYASAPAGPGRQFCCSLSPTDSCTASRGRTGVAAAYSCYATNREVVPDYMISSPPKEGICQRSDSVQLFCIYILISSPFRLLTFLDHTMQQP